MIDPSTHLGTSDISRRRHLCRVHILPALDPVTYDIPILYSHVKDQRWVILSPFNQGVLLHSNGKNDGLVRMQP